MMLGEEGALTKKLKTDEVMYGIASEKSYSTSYYYDYRVAEKYAELEQIQHPENGPYYVLKRTEHYEIVAKIPSEKEDINGSTC